MVASVSFLNKTKKQYLGYSMLRRHAHRIAWTVTAVAIFAIPMIIHESRYEAKADVNLADTYFVSSPATGIAACSGQSECFSFTVDTRFTNTGATTGTATTFAIPTSGYFNGVTSHAYDWVIDWGDGTSEIQTGSSSTYSAGIAHTYSAAGPYQISIRPNGAASAGWFDAFGFLSNGDSGASAASNRYMFYSINTPFTNLMRTNTAGRFSNIFYGAVNGVGIPTGLFANIDLGGSASTLGMFDSTFRDYAGNSTSASIPAGLFSSINTSGVTNMAAMFSLTFWNYASNSASATIPSGLFSSIDTSSATSTSAMFRGTFLGYAYNSTVGTIPAGLFSSINTSNSIDTSNMFGGQAYSSYAGTFAYYAPNSTVGTIPAGLLSSINTSKATYTYGMFFHMFDSYAGSSTVGVIPNDIFSGIDTTVSILLTGMYDNTFTGYARREAAFDVGGSTVTTQNFSSPYAVKIGSAGTPNTNPTLIAGDIAYPSYTSTTRTIASPSGAYTGYSWYTKDGSSCAISVPTVNCGLQNTSSFYTLPNATMWAIDSSTELGSSIFYADTTTPEIPVIISPVNGAGTGNSTPTISGTGEPGATVVVKDGSNATICTAVVANDTTWSCTANASLSDGSYVLTVTQTDATGNASVPSNTTVNIDTLAPSPPVISSPASGDVTGNSTPTISGTGEPGATVLVKDGSNTTICTAVVANDTTWSCTASASLSDGNYTFTATQADLAGNSSGASGGISFTIGTITSVFELSMITSPNNTAPVIANAKLTVTSSTCYTIDITSVVALSASGLTAPESNISLLGGIGYSLTCASPGGSANVTITLGTYYSDLSKLRVYKKSVNAATLTDVTDRVLLTNTNDSNSNPITTISYTLVDGGDFDEDGTANGTIVDPLYVGVVTSSNTSTLSSTGQNFQGIVVGTVGAIIAVDLWVGLSYSARKPRQL